MKNLILLSSFILVSCSAQLHLGKYVYNKYAELTIKKGYRYDFKQYGEDVLSVSHGYVTMRKNVIQFIPDTTWLFTVAYLRSYFDPSLPKDTYRVYFEGLNESEKSFSLFINDANSNHITIDPNKRFVDLNANGLRSTGEIVLHARISDSLEIVPYPVHSELMSNAVPVNIGDDNSNVTRVKVNINLAMFAFVKLDDFILRHGKLIKKDCPVFTPSNSK